MPKLPRISGPEILRALERLGFQKVRQRGSHVIMRKGELGCVIPLHDVVAVGTLRSILRQSGISIDDFLKALK